MRGRRSGEALIAVMILTGVVVVAACGGGDGTANSSATPGLPGTAAVTSTPAVAPATAAPPTIAPPSGCPDVNACDFAREVAGLLRSGQFDAVVERAHANDYTCPSEPSNGSGGPFPLCFGAAAGEHRTGYAVGALQSEGAVESRNGLVNFIRAWVNGGISSVPGTGPVIATVGCPVVGTGPDCSKRFAIVFTRGDGTSLLRLGIQGDGAGGAAQISQTVTGLIVVNQAMVSGGDDSLPAVFGIEESVGTRYFVLD